MQRYLDPQEIRLHENTVHPTNLLRKCLREDGQIVPLLVFWNEFGEWECADGWQGSRLLGLIELGFETVLTEDEWEEEDL